MVVTSSVLSLIVVMSLHVLISIGNPSPWHSRVFQLTHMLITWSIRLIGIRFLPYATMVVRQLSDEMKSHDEHFGFCLLLL